MEIINIRGVNFHNVTLDEAVGWVTETLASGAETPRVVFTPNSEIVQLCIEQPEYYPLINSADLIIPDGIGVVKASRILGTPLKGKVAGIELGERVIALASEKGYSVYFLGAKPGVAEQAAAKMREKYPGFTIAGTHDGYFQKTGEENEAVLAEIRAAAPDVLYVCLGVPAQESGSMPTVRRWAVCGCVWRWAVRWMFGRATSGVRQNFSSSWVWSGSTVSAVNHGDWDV